MNNSNFLLTTLMPWPHLCYTTQAYVLRSKVQPLHSLCVNIANSAGYIVSDQFRANVRSSLASKVEDRSSCAGTWCRPQQEGKPSLPSFTPFQGGDAPPSPSVSTPEEGGSPCSPVVLDEGALPPGHLVRRFEQMRRGNPPRLIHIISNRRGGFPSSSR